MVNKYAVTLEEVRVMITANDRFNFRISQNKKNEEIKTVQSISYG